jgi:hypothetical protein
VEQLERPDAATWDERRLWLEDREAAFGRGGAGPVSEQACALMLDLQAAFCAGAWAAVVILAAAVVDLQSNQRGAVPGLDKKERDWLRLLRNALVHEHPKRPGLTMRDQWTGRDRWEKKARRAVEAALAALYAPPSEEGDERAAGTGRER